MILAVNRATSTKITRRFIIRILSIVLIVSPLSIITPQVAFADTAGSGICQQTFTKTGTGQVDVLESGGYCYVAFKNTGAADSQVTYSWTRPTGVTSVDLLVVGGGGSGGARAGGGGGAGGFVQTDAFAISSASTISIAVGAGGNGSTSLIGTIGQSSYFKSSANGLTALGGGAGANNATAGSGGSGGGALAGQTPGGVTAQTQTSFSGTTLNSINFGSSGAAGASDTNNAGDNNDYWAGGGGGGAAAAGENPRSNGSLTTAFLINTATTAVGGKGGDGKSVSWITPTIATALTIGQTSSSTVYFAGGGGGGMGVDGQAGGPGGLGGGATGSRTEANGNAGTAFTGGGGGGSGFDDISKVGSLATVNAPDAGDGGSGVVVLRYSMSACSPTSQTSGGYTILTFTSTTICNWVVPTGVTSAEVLVVAGGGGGNRGVCSVNFGAGGGGGGVSLTTESLTPGAPVAISVGAAGSAALINCNGARLSDNATGFTADSGTNGGNSSFGSVSVTGGVAPVRTSTTGGTSGNSRAGGVGTGSFGAGGGGGAQNVGSGINGGAGITTSISGVSVIYGGGGPGKNGTTNGTSGNGLYTAGQTPTANTGGGGSDITAGAAGIVIVKYINAPSISLSSNAISGTIGSAITSYTISNSGGTAASYSISTAIPSNGTLAFDTGTGLLSGTPTATLVSTSYTITATNTSGTSTATFSLVINNPSCSPSSQVTGGYTILTFTSTTTCSWSVPAGVSAADVLVVGGGGAGGAAHDNGAAGGGGAGYVYANSNESITGTIAVTVGSGGTGTTRVSGAASPNGNPGGNSVFGSITARGGGGGFGSYESWVGSCPTFTIPEKGGTAATLSQAATGGQDGCFNRNGFGGGGQSSTTNQSGGAGLANSITGSSVTYGTGGSGGTDNTNVSPTAQASGTGNGGTGAAATSSTNRTGGAGGSGIVILRYVSTYTVTYAYNNATGGNSTASATFTPGGSAIVLPTPTRTGFSFLGWYTLASGGSLVGAAGADYSPSGTTPGITVQAQWRSSDASLTGLSLSSGTLSPSFASGTTSYTASVANSVSSGYTVTATKSDSNATTVQYIGATGTTAFTGSLSVGENIIRTIVTAQNGSTVTTYTVTVTRAATVSQSITRTSTSPTSPVVGGTYTPTATASSGLTVAITIAAGSSSICTLTTGVVSFSAVGSCVIQYNQAGDASYAAATQVSETLTIGKATPTFSAWSGVSKTFGDSPFTVTAPTVTGALAGSFSYSSATTSVISISGTTLTVEGGGSSVITATFTPTDTTNYNTATTTMTVTVALATQTVTWSPTTALLTTASPATPSSLATALGSASITYSVTNAGATGCTVDSSTGVLTFTTAGSCIVRASAAPTANYAAATRDVTFVISLATRTLTIDSASFTSSYTMLATPPTLTSTASIGGGTKSYASSTLAVCTINSSSALVAFVSAGTCTITATITADATYASVSSSSISFATTLATQTITRTSTSPTAPVVTGTYTPTATASSGLSVAITIASGSSSICTFAPLTGVVSFNAVGSCVIQYNQVGNTNYAAATQATEPLTIGKATPTTTVFAPTTDAELTSIRTTYLQTNPIVARVNTPSKVTFLVNSKAIPGCSAIKTVAAAGTNTATCQYRPTSLGSLNISATITPNSSNFLAVTTSIKVTVRPK